MPFHSDILINIKSVQYSVITSLYDQFSKTNTGNRHYSCPWRVSYGISFDMCELYLAWSITVLCYTGPWFYRTSLYYVVNDLTYTLIILFQMTTWLLGCIAVKHGIHPHLIQHSRNDIVDWWIVHVPKMALPLVALCRAMGVYCWKCTII